MLVQVTCKFIRVCTIAALAITCGQGWACVTSYYGLNDRTKTSDYVDLLISSHIDVIITIFKYEVVLKLAVAII